MWMQMFSIILFIYLISKTIIGEKNIYHFLYLCGPPHNFILFQHHLVFTCIVRVSLGYACWKMMDLGWSTSPRWARLSHPRGPNWGWARRGPPSSDATTLPVTVVSVGSSRLACARRHTGWFIKRVSISSCSFRGRTPSRLLHTTPATYPPPLRPLLSVSLSNPTRRGETKRCRRIRKRETPNLFLFFDPRVCSRFFCDLWRAEDFSGSIPSFVGWSRCLPRFSRQLSLRWPDRPDAPGVPGTKCSTYCAFFHSSVGFSSASEVLRSILMKINKQRNSYLCLFSLWKKRKILTRV